MTASDSVPPDGPPQSPSNLPGEPAFPAELPARLQAALAAKGPGYEPRTHHLGPGGVPVYSNRLVLEGSPYLLQHAHNPVNWYPWGDEAFADARRLGRPVFLSIGYSTCHWCHVMEGESFEDEQIAEYLNQHYIPVKVDREERPDVDAIYMSAVQALTGQGGWPMSVWLTADRAPFFAGTYFPPRDGSRGARYGFLTMLREIRRTFDEDPARVQEATSSLTQAVKEHMEGGAALTPIGSFGPTTQPIRLAVETYTKIFDPTHGGLRRAPKFPSNLPVRLLLRWSRRTGDAQALHMASFTLEKMAAGGMYDQIGGGFHRYSTDERWLVPHFEKMLYDNALLAVAYAEAWQVTHRPDFARVLRETLDYVLREMTSPEGAFYSATDADSEGEEGKFFVWSASEVREVLGDQADSFMRHHDITAGGNFEEANIPNVPRPQSDDQEHASFAAARRKLYEVRARRVPPLRDDKILAAWNGLMISALAVGGRVLGEPRYVDAAARSADFLLSRMRVQSRILRAWKDGQLSTHGFLEDQSFVVQGLLDLFESRSDPRWLREAVALADSQETHFADPAAGGWFMTANDAEVLIAREKPAYDGAEPSGTSVALLNALRLHTFTTDPRWRQVAEAGFASVSAVLQRQPLALTEALLALDYLTDVPRELAVIRPDPMSNGSSGDALDEVVRTVFLPSKALVVTSTPGDLVALIPWLEGKPAVGDHSTAYVCEYGRCELPTSDPEQLRLQLRRTTSYPD